MRREIGPNIQYLQLQAATQNFLVIVIGTLGHNSQKCINLQVILLDHRNLIFKATLSSLSEALNAARKMFSTTNFHIILLEFLNIDFIKFRKAITWQFLHNKQIYSSCAQGKKKVSL